MLSPLAHLGAWYKVESWEGLASMFLSHRRDAAPVIAEAIRAGTRHDDIRTRMARILRELADGTRDRPIVKHPLGFLCLPIHRGDDFGLCAHVWMKAGTGPRPAEPLTTLPIHYHTWNLYSHVLYGLVQNQRITVQPDTGGTPAYRVFEVRSDRDTDEIRPTSELVTWRVDGAQQYGTGDRYLVSPRTYHQSAVLDPRLTVTVMLSENWTPEPQHVLGKVDLPPHTVSRRVCSRDEAGAVVGSLLRHLEG